MKTFFDEIGKELEDSDILKLIDNLHIQEEGEITYTEFMAATLGKEFYGDDKLLDDTFDKFDVDQTGFITE